MLNFLNKVELFIISDIVSPFFTTFFTVIGGAIPITFLIYLFYKKEKNWIGFYAPHIDSEENNYNKNTY